MSPGCVCCPRLPLGDYWSNSNISTTASSRIVAISGIVSFANYLKYQSTSLFVRHMLCACMCYRNWHLDEPSCGYEVCVVMYHQPSAPPSQGGLYMFQWNDDNCETKNNFICKYTAGTARYSDGEKKRSALFSDRGVFPAQRNLEILHPLLPPTPTRLVSYPPRGC